VQTSLSRILAAALSDSLGGPVIVDAKPGAGGNIASEFVSRATPDGYTIILLTGSHAVSVALYRKLRFHPVDSLGFISLVSTLPFVVATRGALWPIDRLVIFYFEPLRPVRYSTIGPTSSAATGAL
jgi:tripartite-type tricarboxylate transporter receptor subunit TctC